MPEQINNGLFCAFSRSAVIQTITHSCARLSWQSIVGTSDSEQWSPRQLRKAVLLLLSNPSDTAHLEGKTRIRVPISLSVPPSVKSVTYLKNAKPLVSLFTRPTKKIRSCASSGVVSITTDVIGFLSLYMSFLCNTLI